MQTTLLSPSVTQPRFAAKAGTLTNKTITEAFAAQKFELKADQIQAIKAKVTEAVGILKQTPAGTTQSGILAVQIGFALGFNPQGDRTVKDRVENALKAIAKAAPAPAPTRPEEPRTTVPLAWSEYFDKTVGFAQGNNKLVELARKEGFAPVTISWEDIGRTQGSVWGDRISDVGIWARKDESDKNSAKLALSVRRDGNFRDKILLVPSQNIKVHTKNGRGQTEEFSLPERLKQLGLASATDKDETVIVSNQFAVVPVPSKEMKGASKEGKPPRTAFNFSIQPYGSKNYVITDVIEGSAGAVVSGSSHQLLYQNVDGEKAPFTASRAEDRKDLQKLETKLKAQGMDVDIQRYYLIQVPLKKDAPVQAADMGTPPRPSYGGPALLSMSYGLESFGVGEKGIGTLGGATSFATRGVMRSAAPGLGKVAIGHGEKEGPYSEGSGFSGQRAEEPVRVTVVYFVTPKGEVTEKDMENMTKTFKAQDEQAIWGGSFVVPEAK